MNEASVCCVTYVPEGYAPGPPAAKFTYHVPLTLLPIALRFTAISIVTCVPVTLYEANCRGYVTDAWSDMDTGVPVVVMVSVSLEISAAVNGCL